jgi:PAS domain-containing protein
MTAKPVRQLQDVPDARAPREQSRTSAAQVLPDNSPPAAKAATISQTQFRQDERRSAGRRRESRSILVPNWQRMAAAFGIGGLFLGLATQTWPGPVELALWLGSTLLALATPFAIRFEHERPPSMTRSSLLVVLVVGLPMLAFGLLTALWTMRTPAQHWDSTIGMPIIVGTLAAIILNRRVPSTIFSLIALWMGIAVIDGSISAWLALIGGIVSGIYATARQLRDDVEADERRQERRRAQDRAQEILSDYEQTGQGWFWETDRRGALAYLSPTIGRALGRKLSDLIGGPFSELFAADPAGQENERTLAFHLTARSGFGELALRAADRLRSVRSLPEPRNPTKLPKLS